jgi:glycosyltransferase involved in cell wall biosynthesis
MRIVIVTDAWTPQVNGVVRTLNTTRQELQKLGHEVVVVEPSLFKSFPNPLYKEIPVVYGIRNIKKYIEPPCAIHIATEGTLGLAFNIHCRRHKIPFTTSYHTNFPDYLSKYLWVPQTLSYMGLRWFHSPAKNIMVSTPTLENKLRGHGFKNMKRWSRGVDIDLFKPGEGKPACIYVGRVAKEKNLEAFLSAQTFAEKIVVGDGPHLGTLKKKFPHVRYLGALHGEELAAAYRQASCFVFPSKSDTFGLVLIEALASGLPIAAYPVEGPIDIWNGDPNTGCLSDNLEFAIDTAMKFGDPRACRELALSYSWGKCTAQFLDNLVVYEK